MPASSVFRSEKSDYLAKRCMDPYDGGTLGIGKKNPGKYMLVETETHNLEQYPYLNICHYYGCIRDGQYLTATCLRKYKHSLHDAVQCGAALDRSVILFGIEKGLQILHDTLGLVTQRHQSNRYQGEASWMR